MADSASDLAMGYMMAADNNNKGSNGFMDGSNGWIWLIVIFALLFGWNGNNDRNGANGGGMSMPSYAMAYPMGGFSASSTDTRTAITDGFTMNGLERGITGIQNGLCDGFYAMNTSLLNGFNGVNTSMLQGFNSVGSQISNLGYQTQQGFNNTNLALMQGQNALSTQLANCCCENREGQAQINYNMATNTCALQNTMNTNTRDIIDSQQAGTRAILDYLCQDKISTLQSENQTLKNQLSQTAQNAVLQAAMDANTAEILRRAAPLPVPSYQVANPYTGGYGYGCGAVTGCGC